MNKLIIALFATLCLSTVFATDVSFPNNIGTQPGYVQTNALVYNIGSYAPKTTADTYAARKAEFATAWPKCFDAASNNLGLKAYAAATPSATVVTPTHASKKAAGLLQAANLAKCVGVTYGTPDTTVKTNPSCKHLAEYPADNLFEYVEAATLCIQNCNNWVIAIGSNSFTDSAVAPATQSLTSQHYKDCLWGQWASPVAPALSQFIAGPWTYVNWKITETAQQVNHQAYQDCRDDCDAVYNSLWTYAERYQGSIWESAVNDCVTGATGLITANGELQWYTDETLWKANNKEYNFTTPFNCYAYRKNTNGAKVMSNWDPQYWADRESCWNFCVQHELIGFNNTRTSKQYTDKQKCKSTCLKTMYTAQGFKGTVLTDFTSASVLSASLAIFAFLALLL